MKFVIEQIAICPRDPEAAKELLKAIGAVNWAEDHVTAKGQVFNEPSTNEADLSFNYDIFAGKEFEVLHYTSGGNWMEDVASSVSHLGMHCTAHELMLWRRFFAERNIEVAQEVFTNNHTNPVIAGKRFYNYVIFDTRHILGVDLKFIVRINATNEEAVCA